MAECLNSVLQGKYTDIEVLCVNDGSTDGTAKVLMEHVGKFPQLLKVIQQKNKGANAARNAGLDMATGVYVQFLDGDDVLMPEKILGQLEMAVKDDADLVIGNYENKFMDNTRQEVLAFHEDAWMALIKTELGTTSSNLFKRSFLENIGGWDQDLKSSQDYELMFRLLSKGAMVCFDQTVSTLVLKRESGSISRTDQQSNWVRYIALRCKIRDHLLNIGPNGYNQHLLVLDQYIFMALRVLAGFDLGQALELYKRELGSGFKPILSKAIGPRYLFFFNLFGFSNAERIIQAMKGIIGRK